MWAVRPEEFYNPVFHELWDVLDVSLEPRGPDWLHEVVDTLVTPNSRVLDIGCRDAAHLVRIVQRNGCSAVGIDPVQWHLDRAAAAVGSLPIEVLAGVAEELPVPDGSVDVVWCRDVLQVVVDVPAAVREVARVLAPGGRALVYTVVATDALTADEYASLRDSADLRQVDEAQLESAFASAGLVVERKEVLGTEWREYDEERTKPVSQSLLRLARLRRQRSALVERFGSSVVDAADSSLQWGLFLILGKLKPVAYVLAPG
ncbi:MAG: putative methyltransferase [Frankiales bacterium]|nr:putative methyltransferase [Frankiales bacterium]